MGDCRGGWGGAVSSPLPTVSNPGCSPPRWMSTGPGSSRSESSLRARPLSEATTDCCAGCRGPAEGGESLGTFRDLLSPPRSLNGQGAVFKRAGHGPHAWMVRLHRRSVAEIPCTADSFRPCDGDGHRGHRVTGAYAPRLGRGARPYSPGPSSGAPIAVTTR